MCQIPANPRSVAKETIANRITIAIPGQYLYYGSAKGFGGLRGRLALHMRHGKSMHWHIDSLTEAGTVLGAWTFPGGRECDLVARLSHLPIAAHGFGSSDCPRCTSHLFRWPESAGLLGDLRSNYASHLRDVTLSRMETNAGAVEGAANLDAISPP